MLLKKCVVKNKLQEYDLALDEKKSRGNVWLR